MNELVANLLAAHYATLPFLSKVAGCVSLLKRAAKNGAVIKEPIVRFFYQTDVEGVVRCVKPDPYTDMVPSSDQVGMLYFEDISSNCVNSKYNLWKGQLKMVVWLNMDRIGSDYTIQTLQGAILDSMPSFFPKTLVHNGSSIKVSQMYPKRPDPFEVYDYNEPQRQFLIEPFEYFSVKVEYVISVKNTCSLEVVLNPINCLQEAIVGIGAMIIGNTFIIS